MTLIYNPQRRHLINGGFAGLLMFVSGCATQPQKPPPIEVDVTGADTVPKLILAIKKAAKGRLPASMPDTELISEFARAFVQHARAAAEAGYKIPQWVLDRLPIRKAVLPVAAIPALGIMEFTAYGIAFTLPVAAVMIAVLGSIVIMTAAIITAFGNRSNQKA